MNILQKIIKNNAGAKKQQLVVSDLQHDQQSS
jgi:hypothetical protein